MIIPSIELYAFSATSREQDRMFWRSCELSRYILRSTVRENLWVRLCTVSAMVITVSRSVMTSSHLFHKCVISKSIKHLVGARHCACCYTND